MCFGQFLRLDDRVQIGAHQMRDQVNIVEILERTGRREHVVQADHVLVVHVLQQTQLSVGAFRVNGTLKRPGQLFDCDLNIAFGIDRRAVLDQRERGKVLGLES